MKTSTITIKSIFTVLLLMGFSNSALADTSISIGFGFGHPRHIRGHSRNQRFDRHRRDQRFNRDRRHHRTNRSRRGSRHHGRSNYSRRGNIYIGGGFRYSYRWPSYYVYTSPRIIETAPVIIEKETIVAQPAETEYDEETQALFEALRYKKNQLLDQLKTGYKKQRREAIKELAGFSFDDEVRQALESVLLLDPDAELRQEVVKAFAEVKNTKALPALEKARVEDWSEDVRKEADKAIKNIKEN
jgi:hypothetical protein